MSKRFTDSKKWRNEWFRTLPMKAKIVWSYICDECEYYGVWKADYGLASFQVDFKFSETDLKSWFGDKVHFFGNDSILIVPFFEFQYGDSKDSWSVKANALKKLETLGFSVIGNKVQKPTVTPLSGTVDDSTPDILSKDKVKGKVNILGGGVGEDLIPRLQSAYDAYPRHEGKTRGMGKLVKDIETEEDLMNFETAVANYRNASAGTDQKFIKHFSTFASEWRDWIEVSASPASSSGMVDLSDIFGKDA